MGRGEASLGSVTRGAGKSTEVETEGDLKLKKSFSKSMRYLLYLRLAAIKQKKHLFQTVRRGRLGRRVIVHSAVDPRPRALLLDHVIAASVGRHFAEKPVQIDLAFPQHRLLEGPHVPLLDVQLQAAHEVALLARVLRRAACQRDRIVRLVVLGDGAAIVLRIPDVHRALERRQHRFVQRSTSQKTPKPTSEPRGASCTSRTGCNAWRSELRGDAPRWTILGIPSR